MTDGGYMKCMICHKRILYEEEAFIYETPFGNRAYHKECKRERTLNKKAKSNGRK